MLCAETEGEIPSLSVSLRADKDIRPDLRHWRWTPTSTWPPIEAVLKTNFWSREEHSAVRSRLLRPAPVVEIVTGGEFVTLSPSRSAQPALGEPLAAEEGEQVPGMAVCVTRPCAC